MTKYTTCGKTDTMTEAGSRQLANDIERYWRRRGKKVTTWIDEHHEAERGSKRIRYCVRSDMVNGTPQ